MRDMQQGSIRGKNTHRAGSNMQPGGIMHTHRCAETTSCHVGHQCTLMYTDTHNPSTHAERSCRDQGAKGMQHPKNTQSKANMRQHYRGLHPVQLHLCTTMTTVYNTHPQDCHNGIPPHQGRGLHPTNLQVPQPIRTCGNPQEGVGISHLQPALRASTHAYIILKQVPKTSDGHLRCH